MKSKNILYVVLTCLALFGWTTKMYGQLDVQQLTEQQGLGNNTINEIHQDHKGFLWIGTDIGITRYDGNFFHTYNLLRPGGGEPISVSKIQETENKYLWLSDKEGTIHCFDKLKEEYIPIEWGEGITPDIIYQYSSTGNFLYAIMTDGLNMLNVKSEGKMIKLDKKNLVPNKRLNKVLHAQGQTLYLTDNDNQLIIFNTQNRKAETIDCQAWGFPFNQITNIYFHNHHLFFCGEFEGIYCYNLQEKTLQQIKISNNLADYKHTSISSICYLKDNRFAISNKRFIYELKFESENYSTSNYEIDRRVQYERQFEQLIRNRITKLYYDSDNHVLWIGTYGNGLVRQNVRHTFAYRIDLPEQIFHINNIVQDSQGYIWLATRKHGILRSTTDELSESTQFVPWNKANANESYHLQKDKNGYLWIGSERGTIHKLNTSTNELTSISLPDSIAHLAHNFHVNELFMNSRNRLWIATEKSISVYDENTGKWLVCKLYWEPYGKVTVIREDAEGVMWLGTENGIYQANVSQDVPNTINMIGGFEEEKGLTANEVLTMHITNTNQILVSYADKITRMEKNKIINHKVLQADIPYGHITCMIDDRNGNTWLGSNESVISIHNTTNTYFAFPMSGNNPTVCRLDDSKLLWGNMPDLLFFDPVKLKDLKRKKAYITDIEVNAKKLDLIEIPTYEAKEINLDEGDHVKFLLSKLNYNAIQNKTIYRILPTDSVWRENHYNELEFDDIQPGIYTLEIKPVYPTPGGEEITSLKIKVSPHWVFSPMALIGYSAIVIAGSILVYRYLSKKKQRRRFFRRREQELKDKLLESQENQKKEEKIQKLQSNILSSISKDIRTPLSIISNSLKGVIDDKDAPEELQKRFKLAYRNSLYIHEINELFIHMQQQNHFKDEMKVSACPAFQITDSVIRSAREIISSCPINIEYSQEKDQTIIWVDYAKIVFTVKNMLSNAFRRTHYAGNIQCSIQHEIMSGKEYCVFKIQDDGKDEESIILQNQSLGLALMKDLASKHHGEFMTKKHEKGTTSLLYIPLGKEHFEGDEQVVFIENTPQPENTSEEPLLLSGKNAPAEEETSENKAPRNKQKILIVEEHKDTRTFLKMQFSNEFIVYQAKNGQEGIEMARKIIPDLIISEAILPVVDGFELTRQIKEDVTTCHTPIILLTTLTNNEDIIKGMELGADDYVRKPFDIQVLISKVRQLIKNRMELKKAYTKLLIPDTRTENTEGSDNREGGVENAEDPLVTKVLQLINDNIQNEDFSVKRLAEMLNMSQPTLYRKIKQATNFTLIEVIRGVRLKRAAELLKSKKFNVQEAAEAVGYNDIPTFRKHFVDFYGVTPSAFSKEDSAEKK